MQLRQSDLKTWARCPLSWRYQHIDGLPRSQGGSSVFGSLLHDCVLYLETTRDLPGALDRFHTGWLDPIALLGQDKGQIDYYERGRNWKKFSDEGPKILKDWWGLIQWESDTVLAREHHFQVPIGNGHVLEGTADKVAVRMMPKINSYVLLISDYKTNAKRPTYDWLADDLQFTAYCYASLQPEFWTGIPNGEAIRLRAADWPRYGEWVNLRGPVRMDAGPREMPQYNRLIFAANALADSVAMRIFVPNISGETCRFCEFRRNCGLPEIPEDAPW
jgi:hypothetical protein